MAGPGVDHTPEFFAQFPLACLTSGLDGAQIAASFKAHCKAGKDEMTGKVTNCIPDEVRPT